MTEDEKFKEQVVTQVRDLWAGREVFYSHDDLNLLFEVTNKIYDRGHRYTYYEVADFATNETNLPHVAKHGIKFVLERIPLIKMPPIKRAKTPGRNEPCACGSGSKFKNCCISKTLAN